MARTNMYLKLEGINGESVDEKHKDYIELLNFTWNVDAEATFEVGLGGQSKQSHIREIHASKNCDLSSVILWKNCTTGRHIPSGHISCVKLDGETRVEYLRIELTDILVKKVSWSGGAQDGQPMTEDLDLVFAEFKQTYKLQQDIGTPGKPIEFKYNVQTARAT